jgi:hypothetical protein
MRSILLNLDPYVKKSSNDPFTAHQRPYDMRDNKALQPLQMLE